MQHCFPPVIRSDIRLLLLGSLPGAVSLTQGRYYAHPRNQFWRLVGALIDRDLIDLEYADRLMALLDAGIGLWDVVASAVREGSLDANIRLHETSALQPLVATLPDLQAVGFNGATSARLGRKALGTTRLTLVDLPSSSPAHTLPFERKAASWLELRRFLRHDRAAGDPRRILG